MSLACMISLDLSLRSRLRGVQVIQCGFTNGFLKQIKLTGMVLLFLYLKVTFSTRVIMTNVHQGKITQSWKKHGLFQHFCPLRTPLIVRTTHCSHRN